MTPMQPNLVLNSRSGTELAALDGAAGGDDGRLEATLSPFATKSAEPETAAVSSEANLLSLWKCWGFSIRIHVTGYI